MPTAKEWNKEIDQRTKDQLTMDLAAFKQLEKWPFFSDAFQLKYFGWMIPEMELRIKELAAIEMGESKIELIAPIGMAPICPKCEHWNAMLDDGYPPDKQFKCRDCGHSVRADQVEVVIWELDKPGMGEDSTYHEINRIPGEKY
jgi:tRNA(Ile2) C34 agmatinyltransferase TiaS